MRNRQKVEQTILPLQERKHTLLAGDEELKEPDKRYSQAEVADSGSLTEEKRDLTLRPRVWTIDDNKRAFCRGKPANYDQLITQS